MEPVARQLFLLWNLIHSAWRVRSKPRAQGFLEKQGCPGGRGCRNRSRERKPCLTRFGTPFAPKLCASGAWTVWTILRPSAGEQRQVMHPKKSWEWRDFRCRSICRKLCPEIGSKSAWTAWEKRGCRPFRLSIHQNPDRGLQLARVERRPCGAL